MEKIAIIDSWKELLKEEFQKPYFAQIKQKYITAKKQGAILYPPAKLTFHALNLTPPTTLKIVILGQDPYHGSAILGNQEVPQAMGLSFSVPRGMPIPPSLQNIYKELAQSKGFIPPNHGDLSKWASNGVLLLNAILSVERGRAASHQDFGWEQFSDAIIRTISQEFYGIVFMLWGNFAKKKAHLIDPQKHAIIPAPHPSPLSRGFLGSGVFVRADEALQKFGKAPMDWSL
ncbi:uracil-DNA glycosylase [Helicobacter mustelae]|uniref:Uracil-DNA glycosylase n=1 Tax=Helicobacter mustelae (strain ATCC 43772 / CCUG 25715 / CIP 103759 / LMG 18044 / NCTC 12198 / R85-136P) TaxID=679897 RepID=D3UFP4_HELM1|nr:uracil-DNA glycosylase [Helicobacter mustelae]CBG39315.1 uracil-DNA glycosylase [Helicobacter mustelae 12198]SQH70827.1 uracil-DNA glycosylase [Helicobacter mustelae]STP11953.1 uracil-DNA glycosylase [Helicobacter mustelae]